MCVRAQVHVSGIIGKLPLALLRRMRETGLGAARGGDVRRAVLERFLLRLLRPRTRDDEVRARLRAEQVQRHDGVFADAAALQKEDLVARGNLHQFTQIEQRFAVDLHEFRPAMAHFHHAHAAAVPVEHFVGGLAEHLFRQGCRSGGEVEDAHRKEIPRQARRLRTPGCARKRKGRLRCYRANGHYRIVAGNPPTRARRGRRRIVPDRAPREAHR
jgi:hypothetical protein